MLEALGASEGIVRDPAGHPITFEGWKPRLLQHAHRRNPRAIRYSTPWGADFTYSIIQTRFSLTSADCCLHSLSTRNQQHKVSSRLQQLPDSAADQNRELRNAFNTSPSERRTYQESRSGER